MALASLAVKTVASPGFSQRAGLPWWRIVFDRQYVDWLERHALSTPPGANCAAGDAGPSAALARVPGNPRGTAASAEARLPAHPGDHAAGFRVLEA